MTSCFNPASPFTTHPTLRGSFSGVDIHQVDPGTVIKLRPGDEMGIAVERGHPVVRFGAIYMVEEDFDEVRRQSKDWSDR